MKICITASAGGHLTEILQLKEVWKGKEYFFISDKRINAIDLSKKEKVYFITPARRNLLNFLISLNETRKIFQKENPDIIISTGAEIGFSVMFFGILQGKRIIYIESIARINSPSLTGRLIYPFIKDFYVQWPESKKFFPKAKYVGAVI
ncbi:MAG: PssD/Cps14F family polysaccharide biosynthesis glycosyltransferase [Candidatus Iainarchaeum sp.]|jgi:UDP-N-acetylglucosamine:LPS N-acetylglucosamine transferase|nr:MAG: UDP-N-acetylglucosamine--N-acetylmuramyl-(pentapeptide) pyrophosphoryl-undecaprenol N-acetylglucosamine transferase [archaeon ADurb.Bin336]